LSNFLGYRMIFKGLYYKKLWIRNLQDIDKFHSKLVSSGFDKHANLNKQTH
jgi:3-methyladenine DNA glycosylase AlkC